MQEEGHEINIIKEVLLNIWTKHDLGKVSCEVLLDLKNSKVERELLAL